MIGILHDCCTETYPCMLYRCSLFKSHSTSEALRKRTRISSKSKMLNLIPGRVRYIWLYIRQDNGYMDKNLAGYRTSGSRNAGYPARYWKKGRISDTSLIKTTTVNDLDISTQTQSQCCKLTSSGGWTSPLSASSSAETPCS